MMKNIRSYLLFSVQPSKWLLITLLLGCWSLMVTANDTSTPIPIKNSQLTMQLSAQEAALNNEGVTPVRWHEALSAYEEF